MLFMPDSDPAIHFKMFLEDVFFTAEYKPLDQFSEALLFTFIHICVCFCVSVCPYIHTHDKPPQHCCSNIR